MPKSKFETIYKSLKQKIEAQEYPYQELLPSENTLVSIYDCSRNTVRRAISMLADDGYVQSLPGPAMSGSSKRPDSFPARLFITSNACGI